MQYYKIIDQGNVIGVGTMLLKWFASAERFFYCDSLNEAEAVQDVLTEQLYRDDWLHKPPDGATQPRPATVTLIDATEYDELYALLSDGEDIPVDPEPEPEPPPQPEPEPEPERPMSIQEMRDAIAELTSMTAKDDIAQGSYFVLHDEVFLATDPIVKGSAIRPGYNCEKKTLSELLGEEGERT